MPPCIRLPRVFLTFLSLHHLFVLYGLGKILLRNLVYASHVSLPIIFPQEALAASSRVLAGGDCAVELLTVQVPVVDVSLQMRLGTEALATVRVVASVLLHVVACVMIQLVMLVKHLPTIRNRAGKRALSMTR